MKRNPRLQHLYDFTVQICHATTLAPAGNGIVVSLDGTVITCARVVRAAGVSPNPEQDQDTGADEGAAGMPRSVVVRFPPPDASGHTVQRRASVVACTSQRDDALVLLRVDDPPPRSPDQVAVMGVPETLYEHPFITCGFSPGAGTGDSSTSDPSHPYRYHAMQCASGTIARTRGLAEERLMHAELVKLHSNQITPSLYGSAILDSEQNLVVGIVSETEAPARPLDVQPDEIELSGDTAWASSVHVLARPPFNLPVRDQPLPPRIGPRPRTDIAAARSMAVARPGIALVGTCPPLPVWVGRAHALAALHHAWTNRETHIISITGEAGAGKSSLVRRWLTRLLDDPATPTPDSIFWWNFQEQPHGDAFFAAAFAHLCGGNAGGEQTGAQRAERERYRTASTTVRVQMLGGMLSRGRYLFVLDGLDGLESDNDNELSGPPHSPMLRQFLEYLAGPGHHSTGVVTSRVPVPFLLPYTTCTHYDLGPLSIAESIELLHGIGVQSHEHVLAHLAQVCEGHAGTLWLAGMCLQREQQALIDATTPEEPADDTPTMPDTLDTEPADEPPAAEPQPPLEHLSRMVAEAMERWLAEANSTAFPSAEYIRSLMRRYDSYLLPEEHLLLLCMSAFRLPLTEAAIGQCLRPDPHRHPDEQDEQDERDERDEPDEPDSPALFYAPLLALDDSTFMRLFQHLAARHILFFNDEHRHFTMLPFLKHDYRRRLQRMPPEAVQTLHRSIKAYYLARAGRTPADPAPHDMVPLVEAVYHAYHAGEHDEAWTLYWEHLAQGSAFVIGRTLGMHETAQELLRLFFPDGDMAQEPWVQPPDQHMHIYHALGECALSLGNMHQAALWHERYYQRAVGSSEERETQETRATPTPGVPIVPIACQLVELYASLGNPRRAADIVRYALDHAREQQNRRDEMLSLAYQAWIAHVRGATTMASAVFFWAEAIERELNPNVRYLYSQRGIWQAEHLLRVGNLAYARRVCENNREACERNHWQDELSRTCRVLGDLDAAEGELERAAMQYAEAIKIARTCSARQDILIEALLARGRWIARRIAEERVQRTRPDNNNNTDGKSGAASSDATQEQPAKKGRRGKRIAIMQVDDSPSESDRLYQVVMPDEDTPPEPDQPQELSDNTSTSDTNSSGSRGTRVWMVGDRRRGYMVTKVAPVERPARRTPAPAQPEPPTRSERSENSGRMVITIDKTDARVTRVEKKPVREETIPGVPVPGSQGNVSALLDVCRNDLYEALASAVATGCRLYEADIRIALAWLYLAEGDPGTALREAHYAQHLSEQMHYSWGQADAAAVLSVLLPTPEPSG